MPFTRRTVAVLEGQLSYLEWNPSGPVPLLLLHGMGDHALVWSNLAAQLDSDFHIVAPDLRGHGESDKPERGYAFTDIIADLEGLIAHLGWSHMQVVSHSWGAKCLLRWAQDAPERFQRMVLVDPFFNGQMPKFVNVTFPLLYRVLPFLSGMGPFASYADAEAQAPQLNQYQGWSEHQQQVFRAGLEQKSDGQWGTKFTIAARNGIFAESVAQPGLTQDLEIPTLLIQPERGLNKRAWQLAPYRKHLNNLQVCTVPGNHWPFLGAPDPFHAVVIDFLASAVGDQ